MLKIKRSSFFIDTNDLFLQLFHGEEEASIMLEDLFARKLWNELIQIISAQIDLTLSIEKETICSKNYQLIHL